MLVNYLKIISKTIKWGLAFFMFFTFLSVLILKYVPVKYPNIVTWYTLSRLCGNEMPEIKHEWVNMKNISPYMKFAVVCSEDYAFWTHHGISIEGIERAYKMNKDAERIVAGGSTLSQQTAKNVFLYQKRSYFRKFIELWFTMLEELVWGKERILEVYMNSVEYGNGIYGIESAANHFFGKSASQLTLKECIQISSIISSPQKHNANVIDNFIIERANHCLMNLHKYKYITEEEYEEIKEMFKWNSP